MADRENTSVPALVKAALVKAFLAGVARARGEAAGRDAYYALKNDVSDRYPAATSIIEELERNPGSQILQEQLINALHELDADNDNALERLAQELMDAAEHGDLTELLDESKRDAGFRLIQEALNDHLRHITRIRAEYPVEDSSLLTSSISHATNVPEQVRQEVLALQSRIRQIIEHIAFAIENDKYRDIEESIESLPARRTQERAVRLIKADRDLRISHETLRLSVDLFNDINSVLLDQIEQETEVNRQSQLMFGNAIVVCELADYVIDFIENFTPRGLRELEDLHQEALWRIEKARYAQRRHIENANKDGVDAGIREAILRDVRERESALAIAQDEWERHISEANQLSSRIDIVRQKIPDLELIRENARLHIEVLEMVSMLQLLRETPDSILDTIDALKGFRLAPLNETRVRRLLGPQD
jgi:hypothetical protein